MKSLLSSNIYEPKGVVAIVGTCLPQMQAEGFALLMQNVDMVYTLCLEESHINMAITKIGGMLSTGRMEKLIFATVDRSPHCTQLHYIRHELERMMPLTIPVENYVVVENRPILIPNETIELSKTLSRLAESENAYQIIK